MNYLTALLFVSCCSVALAVLPEPSEICPENPIFSIGCQICRCSTDDYSYTCSYPDCSTAQELNHQIDLHESDSSSSEEDFFDIESLFYDDDSDEDDDWLILRDEIPSGHDENEIAGSSAGANRGPRQISWRKIPFRVTQRSNGDVEIVPEVEPDFFQFAKPVRDVFETENAEYLKHFELDGQEINNNPEEIENEIVPEETLDQQPETSSQLLELEQKRKRRNVGKPLGLGFEDAPENQLVEAERENLKSYEVPQQASESNGQVLEEEPVQTQVEAPEPLEQQNFEQERETFNNIIAETVPVQEQFEIPRPFQQSFGEENQNGIPTSQGFGQVNELLNSITVDAAQPQAPSEVAVLVNGDSETPVEEYANNFLVPPHPENYEYYSNNNYGYNQDQYAYNPQYPHYQAVEGNSNHYVKVEVDNNYEKIHEYSHIPIDKGVEEIVSETFQREVVPEENTIINEHSVVDFKILSNNGKPEENFFPDGAFFIDDERDLQFEDEQK